MKAKDSLVEGKSGEEDGIPPPIKQYSTGMTLVYYSSATRYYGKRRNQSSIHYWISFQSQSREISARVETTGESAWGQ